MGFKAFMPVSDPSYPNVTDAELLDGMRMVKAVGGLVLVHAESDSLLQAGLARMRAQGRRDPLAHHEARPPFVEEEAVHRALYLAAHAGVRIQIVHVSSPVSAELVAREKRAGRPVTHGDLPASPAARPRRPGAARPLRRVRAGAARARPGGAPVGLRARRHGRLPRLGSLRLHARGEGRGLRRHLRGAARLPGDAGDDAARARRGIPSPRHVARRLRALLLDQRGAHQRHVSAQGDAAARAPMPTSCSTTSRATWQVDAASQQFSKNPWSPFDGRHVQARVMRTSCAARRCTPTARSWPRPARGGSSPAAATTPSAASGCPPPAAAGPEPPSLQRHLLERGPLERPARPGRCGAPTRA